MWGRDSGWLWGGLAGGSWVRMGVRLVGGGRVWLT